MKTLASPADIVFGGGAAGLGKTFTLLLEFLRHIDIPRWGGVIFRRTSPQIRNQGGLWDTSMGIYPSAGGKPKESVLEWDFKRGPRLKFAHLEHEKNIYDWQGSQIPFIGFDELTHFSRKMFFYLLSRNRSTCGIRPYMRATCNPDPDSWVADFISWWIDSETGLPIPERDGVIRYFAIDGELVIWGDTVEEVIEKAWYFLKDAIADSGISPVEFIKSFTFISGSIYDNKELLKVNPAYLANLLAQDEQTKLQLFTGSWKVIISDIEIYNYHSFAGMFNNRYSVRTGEKYITADIALKGSNKFVIGVWDGFELIDLVIMARSDGKEVIEAIERKAIEHKIPNHRVHYDNDGVGGFVDGFIVGAQAFNNGGAAIDGENYKNLKTQCYYKSGDRLNKDGYIISEPVANMMYDDKMTVRQRFMYERRAIKRDKADMDGKLCIIPKEKMKTILNGDSPDLMDMFMMRERPELGFQFKPSGGEL
jgi:hypothetical protein